MAATASLVAVVGVSGACLALGVPRATCSRWRHLGPGDHRPPAVGGAGGAAAPPAPPAETSPAPVEPAPPRALSATERPAVLDVLHADRFCDAAPAETYATLLDEGTYLASERTRYRLLAATEETGARRNQRVHPPYAKPELLATAPNEVWSWDITKLLGPAKWTYFSL